MPVCAPRHCIIFIMFRILLINTLGGRVQHLRKAKFKFGVNAPKNNTSIYANKDESQRPWVSFPLLRRSSSSSLSVFRMKSDLAQHKSSWGATMDQWRQTNIGDLHQSNCSDNVCTLSAFLGCVVTFGVQHYIQCAEEQSCQLTRKKFSTLNVFTYQLYYPLCGLKNVLVKLTRETQSKWRAV